MQPGTVRAFLHDQRGFKAPKPTADLTGQTVIVTGSNVGIGLEAARGLASLNPSKVILAVRNVEAGLAAAKDIGESIRKKQAAASDTVPSIDVWKLDLASSKSVESFAARAERELDRIDILLGNAGVLLIDFSIADGSETTMTVNVINTFMLAFLLLPKMRETSISHNKEVVLPFTGSFVNWLTQFPERKNNNIFEALNDPKRADMEDRYNVSKLIHLLITREFAAALTASDKGGDITTSHANPGAVVSDILRHLQPIRKFILRPWLKFIRRSTEEGGMIMVHAAQGGKEFHGQYLSECQIGVPSDFARSEESQKIGKQLWQELSDILEKRHPGIMSNI